MKKNRQIHLSLLWALIVLFSFVPFSSTSYGAAETFGSTEYMEGIDRPGMDLFSGLTFDPIYCQTLCEKDPSCKAWTYVKLDDLKGRPDARCWLKKGVPPPVANPDCISAVKEELSPGVVRITRPGSGLTPNMELNTDRPGEDLFDGLTLNPKYCQNLCNKDEKCKAWTFVKANTFQGKYARCWLKDGVPPPVNNVNCISGVKQGPPPSGTGLPPKSTSGDLAAWGWCYWIDQVKNIINFYGIIKNVGQNVWASEKEGYYVVGAVRNNVSVQGLKGTIYAFPSYYKKDEEIKMGQGNDMPFDVNSTYQVSFNIYHSEDTNHSNDGLHAILNEEKQTVYGKGEWFLPSGPLFKYTCK